MMIYRFRAKLIGSGDAIEVQIQAPPDTRIDELCESLRSTISEKGVEIDSLRYIGSAEPGVDGFVPIHEWHDPTTSEPANRVCIVQGCGQRSTFHLCQKHALPGMVLESGYRKLVISAWLVEQEGRKCLITLDDYALGNLFGGREAFEEQLRDEGYGIRHLVSSERELYDIESRNPGISMGPWIPQEWIPQVSN